jgi:peptide/nickel transport system permease protein
MRPSKTNPKKVSSTLSLLASYLLTIFIVFTLNFLIPRLLPGDPLSALLDSESSDYVFDPQVRQALEAYYGLDQPLAAQYGQYLLDALRGDLGASIQFNQPVTDLIQSHLPWTLLLTLTAMFAATLFALIAGSEAGWQRATRTDRLLTTSSIILANTPVYFLGMILIIIFGAKLDWLPLAGGRTAFAHYDSFFSMILDIGKHLILPAFTLSASIAGVSYLLIRNNMTMVIKEDFMLVARSKGITVQRLKWAHALRNAILPFIAHMAAHASMTITGAVFIETLFNYPGMGRLIFDAVGSRDYPVIQGVFLIVALIVVSANLLADLINARLDPRIREPLT